MALSDLRIQFACVAGNAIGSGHLSRCLALASFARAIGMSADFLVFGDSAAKARIEAAGFESILADGECLEAAGWPLMSHDRIDVVVADFIHPGFFSGPAPAAAFCHLRKIARQLVAIDSLGDDSILGKLPDLDVDLVVCPYVMPRQDPSGTKFRILAGPDYALLAPAYADLPPRLQRPNANRVLVTCGGSDPKSFTIRVLDGLETVTQDLEIRIVIGPMFAPKLIDAVARQASVSKHRVELLETPSTLLDSMLWCDVAISASGLTKYELAASGTPSLVFSIDAFHDAANRPFAARHSSVDLGIGISKAAVRQEIERLLRDASLRTKMAETGRSLIDGAGTKRLFEVIMENSQC